MFTSFISFAGTTERRATRRQGTEGKALQTIGGPETSGNSAQSQHADRQYQSAVATPRLRNTEITVAVGTAVVMGNASEQRRPRAVVTQGHHRPDARPEDARQTGCKTASCRRPKFIDGRYRQARRDCRTTDLARASVQRHQSAENHTQPGHSATVVCRQAKTSHETGQSIYRIHAGFTKRDSSEFAKYFHKRLSAVLAHEACEGR